MQKQTNSPVSELDGWIVGFALGIVVLAFFFVGLNATIDLVNTFTQLAPRDPFEAQGSFNGHGEGRVSDALGMASTVLETHFNVGRGNYDASGPWIGPLPPFETVVKVTSPTGIAQDVVITDLTTGRIYRSAVKTINVLQILGLGAVALIGWSTIFGLVIFGFIKARQPDPEDDAEED